MQRTCDLIEMILRQLGAQSETINSQRMLTQLLLSKFPIEVIFQLEKSKEPTYKFMDYGNFEKGNILICDSARERLPLCH